MDVHKDTVMVAVLPESAEKPTTLKQLPNHEDALRRFLARVDRDGELRCCYEASGAGYVLHRAIKAWGHRCEVIAPPLILTRPGHHRKHDRIDAIELAQQHRALDGHAVDSEDPITVDQVVSKDRVSLELGRKRRGERWPISRVGQLRVGQWHIDQRRVGFVVDP